MKVKRDKLRMCFEEAGWEARPEELLTDIKYFGGLFSGGFAICAVAICPSSDHAIECWSSLQGALTDLKVKGSIDKSKDLYLLFVVDLVNDDSLGKLHKILDDTRVCRKIVLNRRNRTLADTLDDVPFFRTPGVGRTDTIAISDDVDVVSGVSDTVKWDLERRSAEYILKKLMDGEYEVVN